MSVEIRSAGQKVFGFFNVLLLTVLGVSCLLPFVHMIALSFSANWAVAANRVGLLPLGANVHHYEEIFKNAAFLRSFLIAVVRSAVVVVLQMTMTMLMAYPLHFEVEQFRPRKWIVWFLLVPGAVSGGLIPTFLLMRFLGLLNTWVILVVPFLMGNVILMMNFFRGIPKAFQDSAMIDGASHPQILFRVYMPLAMAAVATLSLFGMIGIWNEWFTAILYISDSMKWPLQSYLRTIVISSAKLMEQLTSGEMSTLTTEEIERIGTLSDRSFRAALIMVSTVPILVVFPLLQKHFAKGIVLGSIKGGA